MNKKNVSCKTINWQWFPRLAHAWDVLWYDIVSVDQIALGKCDCRTVILAIIFYRSLVSESSVTGLGVYTRRWVYDNITPHSLCYLARVRPVLMVIFLVFWTSGITSGKKVCRELKKAAILKILKCSTQLQFDLRYEKIVPNYAKKSIFMMMTSSLTSQVASKSALCIPL